ncbi:MAG: hypothetical protein KatS3mg024_0214 [Armatimonadota bacterium]|nr:MAG: hypothetical protein KatS3mg024_0214 [Armatimonadota bacterium]
MLSSDGQVLKSLPLAPADSEWDIQGMSVAEYLGEDIILEFRQHTNRALYGYATWIDNIALVATDVTPPSKPVVTDDGPATGSTTILHASWTSTDPETGIAEYQYAIGTSPADPGSGYVVPWKSAGTATEAFEQGLSLVHGQRYYWYVRARNGEGVWSAVGVSDGIIVDTTPPVVRVVLDDGDLQAATDRLRASWQAEDPESGIAEYEYAIGTTPTDPGSGYVVPWTSALQREEAAELPLSLQPGQTYYWYVRAKNGVWQWSGPASSDGILVAPQRFTTFYSEDFSAGFGPEWYVTPFGDPDRPPLRISATPLGNRRYLGAFGDQTLRLNLGSLPDHTHLSVKLDLFVIGEWEGIAYPYNSQDLWSMRLLNGPEFIYTSFGTLWEYGWHSQAYPNRYPITIHRPGYGSVAKNILGYSRDSVYRLDYTVEHQGADVTIVMQGLIIDPISNVSWGIDSITVSLALVDSTPPMVPTVVDAGGFTSTSGELTAIWTSSDPESVIAEYQYAIGTSPTDPGSGYVVGWKSAGLATEVTETGLTLQNGVTYYWYVKARNGAGLWSLVGVSDGITVDLGGPDTEITSGPAEGGFTPDTVARFEFAGSDDLTPPDDLQFQWSVDGGSWSDWQGATSALVSGLGDGQHTFSVRSRDLAGNEDPTPATVTWTVDTTPPGAPMVTDEGSHLPAGSSVLSASWSALDPESGIVEYEYAIGTSRADPGAGYVVGWKSAGAATAATELELPLQTGQVYYWYVRARNGAGVWSLVGVSDGIKVGLPVLNPSNGHYYEIIPFQGGWQEANLLAQRHIYRNCAGYLGSLTSYGEMQWLMTHLPSVNPLDLDEIWIGGYQDRGAPDFREPDRGWRWTSGEPWVFAWWHPAGEPNEFLSAFEDFVMMHTKRNGYWYDLPESGAGYIDGYLVEYDVVDTTAPSVPVVWDGGDLTSRASELSATWSSQDEETGIAEYWYAIGTSPTDPGSGYEVVWKSAGTATEAVERGLNLQDGVTYYWYVKARNGYGLWSAVGVSDGMTVDSIPPHTVVTSGPANGSFTASSTAAFAFSATDNVSSAAELVFQWRLDGGDWIDWSTEGVAVFHGLADGPHTFEVRARDEAGNVEVATATVSWTVDTSGPGVPVVTDDGAFTASVLTLSASWESTDTESGIAEYQYAIGTSPTDPGSGYVVGWKSAGPAEQVTETGLSLQNGVTYYWYVKARNGAGLWSLVGVSDGITVDLTPPDTLITGGPTNSGLSRIADATFTFSGTDNLATSSELLFQWRLDNGEWSEASADTSAHVTNIPDGVHTFQVRAVDGAGNADPTPASVTWRVLAGPMPPEATGAGRAKLRADGVEVLLTGCVVTASPGQAAVGRAYVESLDRSSGLALVTDVPVLEGQLIEAVGRMGTNVDGERVLTEPFVRVIGQVEPLDPVFVTLAGAAGGPFAYNGVTGSGQRGVTDPAGRGLNMTGLLVRVSGWVSEIDSSFIHINEGSLPVVGGVRVSSLNAPSGIRVNDFVTVTGICSMRRVGLSYQLVIRPRSSSDFQVVTSAAGP